MILYDFEASPWCRLVREYLTLLDLTVHVRPCPRQTLFYGEGAFTNQSRFRPQAMALLRKYLPQANDDLMFPMLVDQSDPDKIVVLQQSYEIIQHLWSHYGESVLPTKGQQQKRRDQQMNSSKIPFVLRFLSLAAPSYVRPCPSCGVMRLENTWDVNRDKADELVLYQSEGCPASRLVRESLCSLEIPYKSVPVAEGSQNVIPSTGDAGKLISRSNNLPVLVADDGTILHGHDNCLGYLQQTYLDPNAKRPTWFDSVPPEENLSRRQDGTNNDKTLMIGAYLAFWKGSRAFVPPRIFE